MKTLIADLSVQKAKQDTAGIVKGSDSINVGDDGSINVNTNFEQAAKLANMIAGEAIASVLGKVSKSIAVTMNLDQNALLKNMISEIDVNDAAKVPSSAYIHKLVERIGMEENLKIEENLTAAVNTLSDNFRLENCASRFAAGSDNLNPLMYCRTYESPTKYRQLVANDRTLLFETQDGENWTKHWEAVSKSDLFVRHISGTTDIYGQLFIGGNYFLVSVFSNNFICSYTDGTIRFIDVTSAPVLYAEKKVDVDVLFYVKH